MSATTLSPLTCAPFRMASRPLTSETVPPLSSVVSVHAVPLPFSLPFAPLTLAKTLIP
ncbi:hypothetical protein D3C73_1540810 [compost metagenome]